jgi:hypothetical protein
MLRGKVIYDKSVHHDLRRDYTVQVGSVVVDISDDVRTLILEFALKQHTDHEQAIADMHAKHAEVLKRYSQIARIVLADGAGMPTG